MTTAEPFYQQLRLLPFPMPGGPRRTSRHGSSTCAGRVEHSAGDLATRLIYYHWQERSLARTSLILMNVTDACALFGITTQRKLGGNGGR